MHLMAEKIEQHLLGNDLLKPGLSYLLALSGGKDSVCLFYLFLELKERYNLGLSVFHLNHNMRGIESDGDASFVRALGEKHGLPVYIYSHNFESHSNFENSARKVRYDLINSILDEKGIDFALTAHSGSDNVETVLMRFFKGTTLKGLSGIPFLRGRIIRPLLEFSTSDVLEYLCQQDIAFRVDSSNDNDYYERNFMRNSIVPLISERYPLESAVQRFSEYALSTYGLLERKILGDIDSWEFDGDLYVQVNDEFKEKDYFSFIIAHFLRQYSLAVPGSAVIDEVYKKFCVDRSHVELYQNELYIFKTFYTKRPVILFSRKDRLSPIEWGQQQISEDNLLCTVHELLGLSCEFTESGKQNSNDCDQIFIQFDGPAVFTVRQRRDGDVMLTPGGRKKIKKILIDKKFSDREKSLVAVLEFQNKIAALLFPPYLSKSLVSVEFSLQSSEEFSRNDKRKKILAIRCSQK